MQSKNNGWMLAIVMIALATASFAQRARIVSQSNMAVEPTEELFMNRGDNERGLQVKIKGKVEFTADYRDVETLSRNGFVHLRETRGAQVRRLEIEADKDGALQRTYFVNDGARAFEREAGQWLAEVMRETVRQGGYDAQRRVAHLFKQGGASAVLDVVPLLKDDFGKRVYFEHLLRRHSLEVALVPRVIKQAARDIDSPYEKRQALIAVPRRYLNDPAVINELIVAAGTLDSDHERGQMLADFAQGDELTEEQLNGVLRLIGTLAAPYDRAEALIGLHRGQPRATQAHPGFFAAANGVGSAYEHSRLLLAVMQDRRTDAAALKLVIESATHISTDYEMAGVLLRAAALSDGDEEIRQRLTAAAKSIRAEYERGRVLAALAR